MEMRDLLVDDISLMDQLEAISNQIIVALASPASLVRSVLSLNLVILLFGP